MNIAGVPAGVMAVAQGPNHALSVLVLLLAVQRLDGTPSHRSASSMPR